MCLLQVAVTHDGTFPDGWNPSLGMFPTYIMLSLSDIPCLLLLFHLFPLQNRLSLSFDMTDNSWATHVSAASYIEFLHKTQPSSFDSFEDIRTADWATCVLQVAVRCVLHPARLKTVELKPKLECWSLFSFSQFISSLSLMPHVCCKLRVWRMARRPV